MDYAEMGRRIRLLRRQQNLTQQQLGERIGVSTSFIGHIERGSRITSLETFAHLCAALNASPAYLLSMEDEMLPLYLSSAEQEQLSRLLLCACKLVRNQPFSICP